MPRDSNGNYTLPSGNPVVTGTVIAAGWANPTMGDIGNELTNSLDRQGRGGMLAPFKFLDGTAGAPGMTWTTEPTMGFFRAGASDMEATVAGVPRMRWTSVGVDVWDTANSTWLPLTTAAGSNFALLNAANKFTAAQNIIVNATGSWTIWKDATPTLGARLAFNINLADGLSLDRFNGTSWAPVLTANGLDVNLFGNVKIAPFFLLSVTSPDGTFTGTLDANNAKVLKLGVPTGGIHANLIDGVSVWQTSPQAGTFGDGTPYPGNIAAPRRLGVMTPFGGEVGVYCNDGTVNGRTSLFALTTSIGLDWNRASGLTHFEFRRAGTTIFRYNEDSIEVLSGASFRTRSPDNLYNFIMAHDSAGGILQVGSGSTGIGMFVSTQKVFEVTAGGLNVTVNAGASVANDLALNRTGGVGGGSVGMNTWIQLFNTSQGAGWGFQLGAPADGAACRFYGYNGGWDERFRMDFSGFRVYWGAQLIMYSAGNGAQSELSQTQGTGGGNSFKVGGEGAILHHKSSSYQGGAVTVSSSAAPATGQRGDIYLQVI